MLCFAMIPAMAQNKHDGNHCAGCPHHQQHQAQQSQQKCGQEKQCCGLAPEITTAFPTAKSVKKETKWTVVYDAKKKVLGYAVYSKPASNGIKGYNGETPLMVALDVNEKIVAVVLLNNNETPGYLARVVNSGMLKSWDGMKVSKARKKKVDTVSGATYSSKSIIQTLQAALKQL